MLVRDSIRRVHRYPRAVEKMTADFLKKEKDVVSKMNVQQLERGQKPSGQLYEGYSPATEARNSERATPVMAGEPIKLKDTGKFHEGIYRGTKAKKNEIIIKSSDSKNDMLEKHWRPFGLIPRNREKLTKDIYDNLYKQLKEYFR